MSRFIVAAKTQYSVDGAIETLGTCYGPFFDDATGLLRKTWYPILNPDISFEVSAAFAFEGGRSSSTFGSLVMTNGADGLDDYILDRLLTSQVRGLLTEVRRGLEGDTWDTMEPWLVAHNNLMRFDGEQLTIGLRTSNDKINQPLTNLVFADDTPNERIVNQNVPILLGEVYQLEPLIFDAFNQVYYTARNVSNIRDVQEGGGSVSAWVPVSFGHQMTAGTSLPITVNAVGPPPDTSSVTNRVNWQFDAWTSDDPDGITVTETATEAEISEAASGTEGDISITGSPVGDSGFVAFTSPTLFAPWGFPSSSDWTASSGTVPDAIVADDGTPAEVSTWREAPVFILGVDPALPADSIVTGVELEVIAEGTNCAWDKLSVIDQNGFELANYPGQVDGGDFASRNFSGAKATYTGGSSTYKTTIQEFETDDVNPGIGVVISVRQNASGAVATAKIHRVRIKLHYATAVATVKLETPTDVITEGKRYRVKIVHSAADVWARWAGVAASADPITSASDPFSITTAKFDGSGQREFEFVADHTGPFAFEYLRRNTAGTATVDSIVVDEIADGVNTYSGLVPYMAEQVGLDASAIDQTAIDAHDAACGSPALGHAVLRAESMAEMMDLFARDSLFGAWWDDYDGKIRSALLTIETGATPELSLQSVTVDGLQRNPYIEPGSAEVIDVRAESATERAVAARNWRPLRVSEVVEIGDGFSEQDRANAIEEFRVIRKANFDDLNPWPDPPPPLSLTSVSPTSGDEAGGTAVTATGTGFESGIGFTIGGASVTNLTVVSDTEATFDTPSGTAGAVDVVVSRDGDSDTLVSAFTYVGTAEWHTADQQTSVDGGSSGPFSITAPTNITAGDLLVFIYGFPNESGSLQSGGSTVPSGFTLAAQGGNLPINSSFDPGVEVYTKVATGSEPASYTYDPGGSEQRHSALIGRVTGASTVGNTDTGYGNGAPMTATSVDSQPGALVVAAGLDRGGGTATLTTAGATQVAAVSGGFNALSVAVISPTSTGPTGTVEWTMSGEWATVTVELE